MAAFFLSTGPGGVNAGRLERDVRGRYGKTEGTSRWEMIEEEGATSGGEFSASGCHAKVLWSIGTCRDSARG